MTDGAPPEVLERADTPRGELVLRRVGAHFEVVSNGTFLMDTRDGRSERALVREALQWHGAARSLLVGGLGVGFSLLEAVADGALERVVVVEVEERLVDWHRTHLAHKTGSALSDPRVTVVVDDLAAHVDESSPGTYDVLCVDVDNGPEWTVTETNSGLYSPTGLYQLASALAPGGVLAVWSAQRSTAFEQLLRQHLADVRLVEVPTQLARGEPDVVYLARSHDPTVS